MYQPTAPSYTRVTNLWWCDFYGASGIFK